MTKQIEKISEDVTKVTLNNKQIIIVGTAHVSEKSAATVEAVIKEQSPECVALELCEPRLQAIRNPNRWEETDIFNVIKSGRSYVLFAQLVLASFQKRVAQKLGIRPGEEMLRALNVIDQYNLKTALIDREVRTTLKRAWAKTTWWSSVKLMFSMCGSLFTSQDEISAEEIEKLKGQDALTTIIDEFSEMLPGIKSVLIDERDLYMVKKLSDLNYSKIVAVVGAGHVPGMLKAFDTEIDLKALEEIPPASISSKLISWGIPAIIIGTFIYGYAISPEIGAKMFSTWFIVTGGFAALGALASLAHPLTIISAFLAAPFTTLNPTIAAGWVCGLVEAFIRKPRVKDFHTIADDLTTVKGLFGNRLSRTLLVVAFANIGGTIGTFVGSYKIFNLL